MGRKIKYPFGTLTITEKSKKLIRQIVDTGRVSQGKYVQEFEERFAKLIGAKEAVAVSSGTDACALALACLYDFGAERGDEIIIPALSFVATGNAVLQAGFRPVFADIDRDTLNLNPQKMERAMTKNTRAVMPVHLMGKPAEMKAISAIAKRHKFYVIEDAAEAHGAVYRGRKVGTLGDLAAFSLYVAHLVSTVEGGIIVTDRPQMAAVLRSLRAHGRACKCARCVLNTSSAACPKRFPGAGGSDIRFNFERIGYSAKMNELEAAIGLGSLDLYEETLEKRRKNLDYLIKEFRQFRPQLATIEKGDDEEIGPHALPIVIQEGARFTRKQFVAYLEQRGIDTRTLFLSIPTQCPGFKFLGYHQGDFPNAEYVGNHGIHVGVHQGLDREKLDYLISTVKKFLHRHQ